MSRLRIYDESNPSTPILETRNHPVIGDTLGLAGVCFERWRSHIHLAPGASQETVIAAYRRD
ncbi:MAG: hypothetical protein NW204_04500, partial [Xanthomonadaceae bacterium]|nr:hypothetical protein [Xanthomonadaceae bacterium]